ncbi:MAG: HPP family protein [Planctomycetota bacterium]
MLGAAAWGTEQRLLAPPLGVSLYNALRAPGALDSAPRSILVGHAVGLAAGLASLALASLGDPFAGVGAAGAGLALPHAAASPVAVGLTAWANERLGAPHPPALATTLLASLGLLAGWGDAAALLAGAAAIASWRWARAAG